jgi:hypothetical protein
MVCCAPQAFSVWRADSFGAVVTFVVACVVVCVAVAVVAAAVGISYVAIILAL